MDVIRSSHISITPSWNPQRKHCLVKKDLSKSWFLAAFHGIFGHGNNGLYSLAGLGFIVHIFFGESHRMTENTGEMVNEDCWKTADVEDCCKIIARLQQF